MTRVETEAKDDSMPGAPDTGRSGGSQIDFVTKIEHIENRMR